MFLFFFKQNTAYYMRIIYWSSDVFSSDLSPSHFRSNRIRRAARAARRPAAPCPRLLHRPASAWQKSAKAARESRDASCRKPKIRAPAPLPSRSVSHPDALIVIMMSQFARASTRLGRRLFPSREIYFPGVRKDSVEGKGLSVGLVVGGCLII